MSGITCEKEFIKIRDGFEIRLLAFGYNDGTVVLNEVNGDVHRRAELQSDLQKRGIILHIEIQSSRCLNLYDDNDVLYLWVVTRNKVCLCLCSLPASTIHSVVEFELPRSPVGEIFSIETLDTQLGPKSMAVFYFFGDDSVNLLVLDARNALFQAEQVCLSLIFSSIAFSTF